MRETSKSADTRNDDRRYDDIIGLPHHVSKTRIHMPAADRAAQFSPFAALTGYEAAVKETARLTDERIELDESSRALLDEKLNLVQEQIADHPKIKVTYFQPDTRKAGGSYVEMVGQVRRIDEYTREIVMMDRSQIPLDQVIALEGELFRFLDCTE